MRKIIFLILVILVISGCDLPQDTDKKSTEEKVLAEEKVVSNDVQQPTLTSQEVAAQAAAQEKAEAVSEEIKVKAIVLAKEDKQAAVNRTSEEIISESRWGFSIYDPKTGIVEYYAREGGYLGKRSVQ